MLVARRSFGAVLLIMLGWASYAYPVSSLLPAVSDRGQAAAADHLSQMAARVPTQQVAAAAHTLLSDRQAGQRWPARIRINGAEVSVGRVGADAIVCLPSGLTCERVSADGHIYVAQGSNARSQLGG